MTDFKEKLTSIETHGISARGRTELIKYLNGGKLSRKEAMAAMCYDCTGYYSDGRVDCELPSCPMYGWMPLKGKKRVIETDQD